MRNFYLDYNIIFYTHNAKCILPLGDRLTSSKKIFVTIEKKVVVELKHYTHALVYQFASFYVFNMEYPAKAAYTMEFLQR